MRRVTNSIMFTAICYLSGVTAQASPPVDQIIQIMESEKIERCDSAAFFYSNGRSFFKSGHAKEALQEFQSAVDACANDPRYWYFKGIAEHALGYSTDSEASLQVASVLRIRYPSREREVLKSLECIQGRTRTHLEDVLLKTRQARQKGTADSEIIYVALSRGNENASQAVNKRTVTATSLAVSSSNRAGSSVEVEPRGPSAPQVVFAAMQEPRKAELTQDHLQNVRPILQGEASAEGLTPQELTTFRTLSTLPNETIPAWVNRLSEGLKLSDGNINWQINVCEESVSSVESSQVPWKALQRVLQEYASANEYNQIKMNFKPIFVGVPCKSQPSPIQKGPTCTCGESIVSPSLLECFPLECFPLECIPCPCPREKVLGLFQRYKGN